MSESPEKVKVRRRKPYRDNSLFGPIVLIAIGGYFLLRNLGYVSHEINWMAALQLWPLALILIGVNVIVRQAPGFLGSFLSGLVGLLAVGIFGYVLLFADGNPFLERFGVSSDANREMKIEDIEYSADGVETADIDINFGLPSAQLFALNDSPNLIEGTVSYANSLTFDTSMSGQEANINLHTSDSGGWFFLDPTTWVNFGNTPRWQIGLNPTIPTSLRLDVGAGSVDLDLSELTLNNLDVDGGAGSNEVWLPGGDYNARFNVSAGSTKITLPGFGKQEIEIDGGAGSLTLFLPPGVEARVEVNGGAGSFYLNENRFDQVSGDERDEGVWETAAYGAATNQIDLFIDVSAGSVRIEDVQGR